MKPYIGITCGTFRDRDWSPPMNILRRTYIEAVATAGGAPFLIPLVDDEEVMRALYDRLDGLLLSGGGDVDPSHYGEEPTAELGSTDPLRDTVELWLARWAAADGKPILGICRGVQMLNVALGGTLSPTRPPSRHTTRAHDSAYTRPHRTYTPPGLRLGPEPNDRP